MPSRAFLLATVAASLFPVNALISVNITGRSNAAALRDVVRIDQARGANFKLGRIGATNPSGPSLASRQSNVPLTFETVSYLLEVQVGSPPTSYKLVLDTGSSNTWVGADANKNYTPTSTSRDTGNPVNVNYGSGSFSGEQYLDRVELSSELVISEQSIGVARSSEGFDSVDGILGIGPVALTQGTVDNEDQIPTVTENLFNQGVIEANAVGIAFSPWNKGVMGIIGQGALTFGGPDPSHYTGNISYVPITNDSPAKNYVGIDASFSYNDSKRSSVLNITAGIVDTGTTLVLLASDAFQQYLQLTGATIDKTTGLPLITQEAYDDMQDLVVSVGGVEYELIPDAQRWPKQYNAYIGGQEDRIYLAISDLGSKRSEGLDFILGMTFLQRFYHVYDAENQRVGFATTPFTNSIVNSLLGEVLQSARM